MRLLCCFYISHSYNPSLPDLCREAENAGVPKGYIHFKGSLHISKMYDVPLHRLSNENVVICRSLFSIGPDTKPNFEIPFNELVFHV
jgi:hypothetical protein